ncbi:hypothetical protein EJ05DRAFT_506815 [Pseudovirgaria hyperparasitica]|uniref:Uncharacterized protein n=1 Tax=Pseudovirgaria hyperparasitica TaxID=470096 RepID=A0A6A6WLW1_9PEZI|nr:uncharacterized protein EJ05DRAFT_506815 [Pseudovirgaria hyperparasitica]KAF2763200.1 hypothetical protein EJ05DRAFT_506815 [Pseudovirgaria hyperparasitica]
MSDYFKVYIGFCQRRQSRDPTHWMLIYAVPGSQTCTWVHVEGGPREGYVLKILSGKRVDSWGIESRELIGYLNRSDEKKLHAAAKSIPLQRCQRWTTALVAKLEERGLIPAAGKAAQLQNRIEPSPYENQGSLGGGSGSKSNVGYLVEVILLRPNANSDAQSPQSRVRYALT